MNENDLKAVVAKYQQKAFELFNTNIILETQVETLRKTVETLSEELEKLKRSKKNVKPEGDF